MLRDGFALTAAGGHEQFATLAAGALRSVLAAVDLDRRVDAAVDHVMAGFAALPVHPDVPDGIGALRALGLPRDADQRFDRHDRAAADRRGVRAEFERLMSVEQAVVWKPARGAYEYAARMCAVPPAAMLLVAVHPWDIDGAARAGLRTAWLNRTGATYPPYFAAPALTATTLSELAETIGS